MAKRRKPNDDHDYSDDENPWTEAQWEAFMKRSDLRVERQLELRETLRDDPERELKVAHEMGWLREGKDPVDDDDDEDESWSLEDEDDGPEMSIEELNAQVEANMNDPEFMREIDEELAETDRQLHANPARRASERLVDAVVDVGEAHSDARRYDDTLIKTDEEESIDAAWSALMNGGLVPGAKLSGAYGIGFDRHAICGAIVNVRRGLSAARDGARGLELLASAGQLSEQEANLLRPLFADVDTRFVDFINELREQVDWDPDRPTV